MDGQPASTGAVLFVYCARTSIPNFFVFSSVFSTTFKQGRLWFIWSDRTAPRQRVNGQRVSVGATVVSFLILHVRVELAPLFSGRVFQRRLNRAGPGSFGALKPPVCCTYLSPVWGETIKFSTFRPPLSLCVAPNVMHWNRTLDEVNLGDLPTGVFEGLTSLLVL